MGLFSISILGALSIIVPVPDTATLFTLAGLKNGGLWVFDPMLIAAAATLGACIGQLIGYIIGARTKGAMTGKFKKNADFLASIFTKFGSIGIFAFALTPLPDNMMFIPLGSARYNPIKAFVPALAGKFVLSLLVIFSSRLSVSIISNALGTGSDIVSFAVSVILGIALTVAMFLVDWKKIFGKFLNKQISANLIFN